MVNNGSALGAGIAASNIGPGTVSVASDQINATGTSQIYGIDARTIGGNITTTSVEANGGQRVIFTDTNQGVFPNIVTITSGIATLTNTAGNSGTAIFANAGTGGATVTSGTASVLGTNQAAIQIFSDGAATLTSDIARTTQSSDALSVQSGTAIRIKSNTITTQGINARGIIVGGFNNPANLTYSSLAINSGSITTAGQNSYGIYITPTTGTTAITSGTIEVRGTDTGTSGAIIANGSNVNVTSGTITNSGTGNRFGVSAQVLGGIANPGNLAVTTGSIATVGTIRPAGTQLRYSAGIIAASAAGPITIASNAIATSGAQSAGIRVEASDGVTAFAFSQAAGSAPASVVRTFGATRGVD